MQDAEFKTLVARLLKEIVVELRVMNNFSRSTSPVTLRRMARSSLGEEILKENSGFVFALNEFLEHLRELQPKLEPDNNMLDRVIEYCEDIVEKE